MNYSNLMEAVNARIKANGRREITGDILNDVLRAMVVELGDGYQMGGTIHPNDKPKVEDQRVAFLAVEPGMYLYAGGFEVTELSLITYGAEWYMYPLGVPFGSQIAEDIAAAVEVEKTRAMAAEKALNDAIATEARERAAADSALDSAIKAEMKRATDAEGVLAKAVEDEKAERIAAVAAEKTAREQADTANAEAITTETAERKAADQTLQNNIDKQVFYFDFSDKGGVYKSFTNWKDVVAARDRGAVILGRNQDGEVSLPRCWGVKGENVHALLPWDSEDPLVFRFLEFEWSSSFPNGDISEWRYDWSDKQPTIRDLAIIRTNAANGQTAFSWGDHAKAGYVKPFIINISGDGSTEHPYSVDKTREEVAAALAANSLILLKSDAADFPGYFEIYTLHWATDYPTQALVLQFGNIDEASLIYITMVLIFSYQEGAGVSVRASSTKLATDEQVKAKQDALISGKNIKTINGESVLGSGDLKAGGLPTIRAGEGNNAEVFNGIAPASASGERAHAEGEDSDASGYAAHSEGFSTISAGYGSHAEGNSTEANGDSSHAEGSGSIANGLNSHAEGESTVATRQASHVEGRANVLDGAAIHQVGIGTGTARKDAHRIIYDGKHYIPGIGGFDGTKSTEDLNGEKDLATVINELQPVVLNYNGLGGNHEPLFVNESGASLTRVQICALLNGVNANRVVLKNKASAVMQTSSAKFLQCDANAFVIGFEGASAAGQIFDILYKWDATAAKVLRAELLYNPTA